jgi:hypothetical protein
MNGSTWLFSWFKNWEGRCLREGEIVWRQMDLIAAFANALVAVAE